MSVSLEIDHGDPCWLSPDLWVVPGNDPNGPLGVPVVGSPAFIWARVHNRGTDGVQNATVRYWWANPGTNFDRTTATQVGVSYVSLNAGETQDVLCLTPWTPSYVNGGHECILGEALEPTFDPLPPGNNFNACSDRHVGQRNLSVVLGAGRRRVCVPLEVHNDQRQTALLTVVMETAEMKKLDERVLATLGGGLNHPDLLKPGTVQALGLARTPCPGEKDIGSATERIELRPGQRAGFTACVECTGTVLVHVSQAHNEVVTGGLSILAVDQARTEPERETEEAEAKA